MLGIAKSAQGHWIVVIKFSNLHRMNRNRDNDDRSRRSRADQTKPDHHNKIIHQGPPNYASGFNSLRSRHFSNSWPLHTTNRQKPSHPLPTKPAAQQIRPSSHRSTAEPTANRQHPSFHCPAGAINRKNGKCPICRRAYKHKYYLKLSASAYPDPGAQWPFPAGSLRPFCSLTCQKPKSAAD